MFFEIRLQLGLKLPCAAVFKVQFGCWRWFENSFQRLENPYLGPLLDGENGHQHHRQHEKQSFYEAVLSHGLEPKVNERAEIGSVEGGHAEHEAEDGHNPNADVPTVAVFGEIDLFLHLLAELRQREEREEGRHNHRRVELRVGAIGQCHKVEGKHPLDEQPSQAEVLHAEEYPNEVHQKESEDDAWHFANLLHHLAQEKLVEADEQAMQRAPNEEVPRRAVPQSRQQEADPKVEVHSALALAVAAKRDVEIVHDKRAQGHVPTAPKLGDGTGGIGVVEVFGELEAHHAPETDGHVAVARKVEVDLEGVGQGDNPRGGAVQGRHAGEDFGDLARVQKAEVGGAEDGIHLGANHVGDEDFLAEADDEAIKALQAVGHARLAAADLVGHVAIADDGTGDELGEHNDIQHEIRQFLHRLVHAAVGVQGVGDALEREERDADGQQDASPSERRVTRQPDDEVQVLHREVAVLVEQQQPNRDDDAEAAEQPFQASLFGLAHPLDQEEVGHRGSHKLDDEIGRAPSVEYQRGEEEDVVADFLRRQEIDEEENRHEI